MKPPPYPSVIRLAAGYWMSTMGDITYDTTHNTPVLHVWKWLIESTNNVISVFPQRMQPQHHVVSNIYSDIPVKELIAITFIHLTPSIQFKVRKSIKSKRVNSSLR